MPEITIEGKTVKISQKSFDELKKAVTPPRRWKPKKGERYHVVVACGDVDYNSWEGDAFDKKVLRMGNVFPSEAGAERHSKRLESLAAGFEPKNYEKFWFYDFSCKRPASANYFLTYMHEPKFRTVEEAEAWGKKYAKYWINK